MANSGAPQGANVKETKQQNVSTAESSGRANTTTTTTNAAVKAEAHRAETSSKTPSGWQEGAKARERQDSNTTAAAAADVRAAAPSVKASNGTDAGSKGRGRGGRGLSRGGGRAKQAKPARAATEAAASSAEVRSPEGDRRRSEKAVEATTPAPQEAAERKEGHSQDLPSSMRKSPRSKEVREEKTNQPVGVLSSTAVARLRWPSVVCHPSTIYDEPLFQRRLLISLLEVVMCPRSRTLVCAAESGLPPPIMAISMSWLCITRCL